MATGGKRRRVGGKVAAPVSKRRQPASNGRQRARTGAKGGGSDFGELVDLDALVLDPENRRQRTQRGHDLIVRSLKTHGAARSIVLDEGNVVLAGNGVVKGAGEAGLSKARIIDADGTEIIAIRRRGLTDEQKIDLAIADNRTAELAEWNLEQLERDAASGRLSPYFTADELKALFPRADRKGLIDPDIVPAMRKTSIRPGMMFQLGSHRIICGDSTDPAVLEQVLAGARPTLMVTEPPYGVEYDPAWRHRAGVNKSERLGAVENDDVVDWTKVWLLFPGDVAYVWHAGVFAGPVQAQLEAARFTVRAQIMWRKSRIVLSRGHYHWQHEPCYYAVRNGATAHWIGDRKQSTAWDAEVVGTCAACGCVNARMLPVEAAEGDVATLPTTVWAIQSSGDDKRETVHGTQKPVECMARAMRNHDAPQVFEPFSGSGTGIIAAEMTGRSCFAIELKPEYVQVAIDRWEAFTGLKAVRVDAGAPKLRSRRKAS